MKKIFSIIILLSIILTNSQDCFSQPKTNLSLLGGMNFSKYKIFHTEFTRPGPFGSFDLIFNDKVMIDVSINTVGFDTQDFVNQATTGLSSNKQYQITINPSIMAGYFLVENNNNGIFLLGGISFLKPAEYSLDNYERYFNIKNPSIGVGVGARVGSILVGAENVRLIFDIRIKNVGSIIQEYRDSGASSSGSGDYVERATIFEIATGVEILSISHDNSP